MRRVYKFFCLPAVDKRLLVRAVILLWLIRFGQWLLPFQTLSHLLGYLIRPSKARHLGNIPSQDSIAWAVTAASRYVFKVTCFTKALTLRVLLQKQGYDVTLCIGVARNEESLFQAHAWVESQGKVLIGGSEREHYIPLLKREERR
ncbi:MAG: lasso peptide biosynthesis B2 protein [Nitrospirota bacterium]|nr:lasso peptide biosynthesis B2 protein [Nitrospirota bacterium]